MLNKWVRYAMIIEINAFWIWAIYTNWVFACISSALTGFYLFDMIMTMVKKVQAETIHAMEVRDKLNHVIDDAFSGVYPRQGDRHED